MLRHALLFTALGILAGCTGDSVVGGAFPDLVFVAEVEGIRRFRFEGGGVVTDLGRTAAGTTDEDMAGAIGMQP